MPDIRIAFDIEVILNHAHKDSAELTAWAERKKCDPQMACMLPTFGKVAAIAWGTGADDLIWISTPNEVRILTEFADALNTHGTRGRIILVGHNIKGFDIPFLIVRYLANKLPVPAPLRILNKKPWELVHEDTMEILQFGKGSMLGLGDVCRAFGIPTPKGDMNGSQVQAAADAEEWSRIGSYCRGDVLAVMEVMNRIAGGHK